MLRHEVTEESCFGHQRQPQEELDELADWPYEPLLEHLEDEVEVLERLALEV